MIRVKPSLAKGCAGMRESVTPFGRYAPQTAPFTHSNSLMVHASEFGLSNAFVWTVKGGHHS